MTNQVPEFNVFKVKDRYIYFLLLIAGAALYFRTIFFQYTNYDDYLLIVKNSDLLGDLRNLPRLFTLDVFISQPNQTLFYRPIMNLSLMLDAQIAGTELWMYHQTNILLHILCAILIFRFLRSSLVPITVAGLASLIFIVHPLLSSAVAWIPGRNDSLLALFVLLTISSFKSYLEKQSWKTLALHVLSFFLSLLTKETAIALPLVCLLYVILVWGQRIRFQSSLPVAATWTVMISAYLLLRSNIHQNLISNQTIVQSLSNGVEYIPAILLYLKKVFFPFSFSIYPNLIDDYAWWHGVAVITVSVLFILTGGREKKLVLWGVLWFVIFLLPSILTGNIYHEHRAYVPFIGMIFAFAYHPAMRKFDGAKSLHVALAVILLVILASVSFVHAGSFSNRWSYVRDAYLHSPSMDDSYIAISGYFMDEHNYEGAERVILEGIRKNNTMKGVYRMLGDIYASRKEYAKSENAYRIALSLDSLDLQTRINYGTLCITMGRNEDAERLWRTTIEMNPDYLLGYYYLANFYLRNRDDPNLAYSYVKKMEARGNKVMPELVLAITSHPKFRQQ